MADQWRRNGVVPPVSKRVVVMGSRLQIDIPGDSVRVALQAEEFPSPRSYRYPGPQAVRACTYVTHTRMSYAYDDVFQDLRRILTYVRIYVCNIYVPHSFTLLLLFLHRCTA